MLSHVTYYSSVKDALIKNGYDIYKALLHLKGNYRIKPKQWIDTKKFEEIFEFKFKEESITLTVTAWALYFIKLLKEQSIEVDIFRWRVMDPSTELISAYHEEINSRCPEVIT
ncbi:hypothetical protein M5X11_16655 [Paenibacillus alginolyticus]|uniref:hypothetical protein n=1 Tax=Paenibacillus alginolyticus TaxID=59839 RepID=UPI0003FCAC35|nr:hypothetical protein [Paenibacillus alginolyticus]MCY9666547.1 hypothetical protein [Paenibacillus alginolyticus]